MPSETDALCSRILCAIPSDDAARSLAADVRAAIDSKDAELNRMREALTRLLDTLRMMATAADDDERANTEAAVAHITAVNYAIAALTPPPKDKL